MKANIDNYFIKASYRMLKLMATSKYKYQSYIQTNK